MSNTDTLLWSGKPKQGIVFTSKDVFFIPFSLVWCGFAVFWTISATGHGAPLFFTLWGVMFVCIGLYFVVGRFIHDSMKRSGMEYSITSTSVFFRIEDPDRVMGILIELNKKKAT